MVPALTTAQAVQKLIDPKAPPLTALGMLSTETRMLVGLIHHDEAMRTAVIVAAGLGSRPSTDDRLDLGLERLQKQAAKSGGKVAELAAAVQQALGNRTTLEVAAALRAAARALRRQRD